MNEQEKYDWMVYVSCMTYNHAPYIVDAMNGFTMQETNFPFVCAVVDDASTDGEQEVIKSYLDEHFDLEDKNVVRHEETDDYVLTFARHKTNKNCYFAVLYLKYNHYSIKKPRPYLAQWREEAKYIAICEGDDMWLAPDKLQKQFDFLEVHPNYSCCYTKYYTFSQELGRCVGALGEEYKDIYDMLWGDVSIATCSLFYRMSLLNDYIKDIKPASQNWLMGDKPLFLYLGYRGITKLIPEYMVRYRILKNSASHSSSIDLQLKRARNTIDIYHYFVNKYFPNNKELSLKVEGGYLYRAYLIYKKNKVEYPLDLRKKIWRYNGKYYKLYAVKLFLLLPLVEKMIYGLLRILYVLKMKLAR